MIFQTGGALGVKPVSLICKMLPQTTASYSGSHKILRIQTLLWDCPFNTKKSKKIQINKQVPRNMIRAYYTLKLGSSCCFFDNGRLVSGLPIHAQFSQAFSKTV
jgi:hypothetical protein